MYTAVGSSTKGSSPTRGASPTRTSQSPLPRYGERSRDASPYHASTLMRHSHKCYAVDYSYMEFEAANELAACAPRSGVVFRRKPSAAAEPAAAEAPSKEAVAQQPVPLGEMIRQKEEKNALLFQFGDKKGSQGKTQVTDDGVVVIKAKDENYAFREVDQGVYTSDKDMQQWVMDANGVLVRRKLTAKEEQALLESRRTLYRCTMLKLNNNGIVSLDKLERAIYLTLYKPVHHLVVVDLSCNQLSHLPDNFLSSYPIHTLLLHGNRFQSIEEVRRLSGLSATLRSLSLYDTPLQRENGRKYRYMVLCALPFLTTLDDVRVTSAERQKVETFVNVFASKKERSWMSGSLPMLKLPFSPSPTPSL